MNKIIFVLIMTFAYLPNSRAFDWVTADWLDGNLIKVEETADGRISLSLCDTKKKSVCKRDLLGVYTAQQIQRAVLNLNDANSFPSVLLKHILPRVLVVGSLGFAGGFFVGGVGGLPGANIGMVVGLISAVGSESEYLDKNNLMRLGFSQDRIIAFAGSTQELLTQLNKILPVNPKYLKYEGRNQNP